MTVNLLSPFLQGICQRTREWSRLSWFPGAH